MSETIYLTPRQWEVARAVYAGMLDKQIAETLGISPRTVSAHIREIYLTAGLDNTAGNPRVQLAVLFAGARVLMRYPPEASRRRPARATAAPAAQGGQPAARTGVP